MVGLSDTERGEYLDQCRTLTLAEIDRLVPKGGAFGAILYDLMRDYPLRPAKALRPALCIAACRAVGGNVDAALPSAAAVELYHNAFLVHDDVEDGSVLRRSGPTLHRQHGVPIAVNVGDAMLAITLRPLLDNLRLLGLGPSLRILEVVAQMSMESAEGQALELDWIRRDSWDVSEADYLLMVHKKTTWYSFLTPVEMGAIAGGAGEDVREALRDFANHLGAAFQIRDDVLNVAPADGKVGKEHAGDLWEGKRTLMLLHAIAASTPGDRQRATQILAKPRPELVEDPEAEVKTQSDIDFLLDLMARHGSVTHANDLAIARANQAFAALDRLGEMLTPSVHLDFLSSLVAYVVERDR